MSALEGSAEGRIATGFFGDVENSDKNFAGVAGKASASATALKMNLKSKVGNDDLSVTTDLGAAVGGAQAEASLEIGSRGGAGKLEAMTYASKVEGGFTFSIGGLNISIGGEAYGGAVGLGVGGRVDPKRGISLEGRGSILL